MKHLILILGLLYSLGSHASISTCKHAKTELKALSCVIYFEARGASRLDKIATAYVAVNRTEHKNYEDDLRDVVYERHQFSWTKQPAYKLIPKNEKAWKESVKLAQLVLDEKIDDPTNN